MSWLKENWRQNAGRAIALIRPLFAVRCGASGNLGKEQAESTPTPQQRTEAKSEASEATAPATFVRVLGRCLWLALCVALGTVTAHGQRFIELETSISLVTHFVRTNYEVNFSVRCVVGTNDWYIQHDYVINAEEKWHYNGTNVCQSLLVTQPGLTNAASVKRAQPAISPLEGRGGHVTISVFKTAGGFPPGDPGVLLPWLAYCSGQYLRRSGRIVPLPVSILRHAPDGFAYADRTDTFADELGLPKELQLFGSKSLFFASVTNDCFVGNHDQSVWRLKIDTVQDGALKFSYSVKAWTNFAGWNVPLEFAFSQNALTEGPGSDFSGTGRTRAIRVGSRPEPLFQAERLQTFVDYRFREPSKSISALTYTSTNQFVAPTNSPLLQSQYESLLARIRPKTRASRAVMLGALVAAMGLPFILRYLLRR
jgi:hypothetical protein